RPRRHDLRHPPRRGAVRRRPARPRDLGRAALRGVAATYSIVARDERNGQLGVAVQSHYFSVGSIVSWAEPGVGAVATQSMVEPAYGPRGLGLIPDGTTARAGPPRFVADTTAGA